MAGVQRRGLQSLLGHKDGRMTMRYSHLVRRLSSRGRQHGESRTEAEAGNRERGTYLAPARRSNRTNGG